MLPNALLSMLATNDAGRIIPGTDINTHTTGLPTETAFSLGGSTILVGMVVVFSALVLLVLIVNMQSMFMRGLFGRKKEPEKAAPVPVPQPEPVEVEPVAMEMDAQEEEEEIAAVISAVLSMCLASGEEPTEGFVVRSIRRVGVQAPAWNTVSRRENM